MSLDILQHPGIQQIQENRNEGGELFSITVQLEGTHTLTDLRRRMKTEFIPSALADMQNKKYRAVFIDPEAIDFHGTCKEKIMDEALLAELITGQKKNYLDSRNRSNYPPSCFHSHQRSQAGTNFGMLNGNLPTLFVRNESEFMEIATQQASQLKISLPSVPPGEDMATGVSQALDYADRLSVLFPRIPKDQKELFLVYLSAIRTQLTDVIQRKPRLGAMNIFAGNVIHCANPDAWKVEEEPGELLAEFF